MIRLIGVEQKSSKVERLNEISPRLAAKDPTLWGPSATAEASIRLDWIDLPEASRELLPTLDALSAWSRELGHQNFILCGMGGSSLAPEVIAAHYNRPLTVLDSTHPDQIKDALHSNLAQSCIIIASKSGSTIETSSHKALFQDALVKSGLDPRNHMVIVTDPDSPLHRSSIQDGLKVVTANPKVGGRFSALSAFGLTPAALIGVDVSVLLDDAYEAAQKFTEPNSVAVELASLLAEPEFAFARFYDKSSPFPGLADWIEQLVAESTGKDGRGVLPVVLTEAPARGEQYISFDETGPLAVLGPLGSQFIFWEWVTAILCYLIEVDPFNQPNVAESKERTGKIIESWQNLNIEPVYENELFEIYSSEKRGSTREYLEGLAHGKYLSIMAYLNRNSAAEVLKMRQILERALGIPTTFGWGPRFLHSTGQFHKGGPLVGSFLQITNTITTELPIPGVGYGFERLVIAQALGDYEALATRKLPVVRINLKSQAAGINQLIEIGKELIKSS
ncbi:MAG: hypothetical protein ACO3HP_00730 [Candidatus Nanopelagicaceae bacterium]